jgi:solute carrier family 30 (zinc transporter), member 2
MNVRAAQIHLIGDTIQSAGVIVSASIIYFFGQDYVIADPICTFMFSVIVMFTTIPLTRECINVLMEGTPHKLDFNKFKNKLALVEGVEDVHDLHIWSIGPNRYALSVHLTSKMSTTTLKEATSLCKIHKIY